MAMDNETDIKNQVKLKHSEEAYKKIEDRREDLLKKAIRENMEEPRVRNIKALLRIQKDSLDKVPTDYMVGLYNGLELARATLEGDEPKFENTTGTKIVKVGRGRNDSKD